MPNFFLKFSRMLLEKGINFSALFSKNSKDQTKGKSKFSNTLSASLNQIYFPDCNTQQPEKAFETPKKVEQEKEEAISGNVKMKVYLEYFKYFGTFIIAIVIFFNVLVQVFAVSSNISLSFWSEKKDLVFFWIFIGLCLLQGEEFE